MNSISPTYLYVKVHKITGLMYFGKTTKKNPLNYLGSGKHWKRHINKHGIENVETVWVSEPFTDKDDLEDFSLFFSDFFDIVNSKEWANLREENGIDGAPKGVRHPENVIRIFVENHTGLFGEKNHFYNKKHTEESKNKMRAKKIGAHNPNYNGKSFTEETLKKLRKPKSNKTNYRGTPGKITCIDKTGNSIQIDKHVYNQQKESGVPMEEWDYVNTNSKVGKKRRLHCTAT